ncbi:MAG TPA: hypothetical protein VNV17_20630 [Solirubrobacteraceae bacterium]|nr:hypothetical protein [Solirubrobacteraceae bacterium]
MRSAIRENALAASVAAASLLAIAWLSVHGWSWPDWQSEARPAVGALLAGHLSQFLRNAPVYGGSLILRAPFVMLTKLWGGGELSIYGASAVPCLVALGALGVWLAARMRSLGRSRRDRALALMLCVANPLTLPALQIGHPEELLGAVLCIAAVLCAMHDRPTWAAVLLGLAIANKEWAVLAVGPVLLGLDRARLRALVVTALTAGTLIAPFILGASGGVAVQTASTGVNSGGIFQPWQIWWFLGTHGHIARGLTAGYRTPPEWIESISHPLIIAVMVPLTALYAVVKRRRTYRVPNAPLLLLTLLLALRCVLDPWDISYYCLPFLLALVTWESLSFDRVPVLALLATFAAWMIFKQTAALGLSADVQALVFAMVSIPSVIVLSMALYAPGLVQRWVMRPRRDAVTPTADWPYARTRNAGAGT